MVAQMKLATQLKTEAINGEAQRLAIRSSGGLVATHLAVDQQVVGLNPDPWQKLISGVLWLSGFAQPIRKK